MRRATANAAARKHIAGATRLKEKLAKLKEEMAKLAAYEQRMLASPDQQIRAPTVRSAKLDAGLMTQQN